MGSQECDIIRWFDTVAENAGEVQRETLRRILELNRGVEYLKKWVGDRDMNVEDGALLESLYTSLVPLSSHADLEPYVQRIADGDAAPLLTHHPITTLSLRYLLFIHSYIYSITIIIIDHCLCFSTLFVKPFNNVT